MNISCHLARICEPPKNAWPPGRKNIGAFASANAPMLAAWGESYDRERRDLVVAVVAAATVISGEGVFIVRVVIAGARVTAAIARLIAVEVVEGLRAPLGERSVIAVTRIVAVVNVAVEVAWAPIPVARSDEDAVVKPVGPIVAVGRALIRSIVKVPVGAHRLSSESDGDLGRSGRHEAKQGDRKCCESKDFKFGHDSSSWFEGQSGQMVAWNKGSFLLPGS